MTYYTGPKTLRNKLNEWFAKQNHIKLPKNAISKLYVSVAEAWTPANLFPTGTEEGLFLDFSDISTLYTDQTFATNISAIGDPVGGVLDKSQGASVGASIIGYGAVGSVGSITAATYNTSTGAGEVHRIDSSNQSYIEFNGLANGAAYWMEIECLSGAVLVRSGLFSGPSVLDISAGQTKSLVAVVTSNRISITNQTSAGSSSFVVNVIGELPGNHLIQATAAARPIWTRHPKSGVRNLLDYSDDLTNYASWTHANAGGSAVLSAFSDGTPATRMTATTQREAVQRNVSLEAGVTYTMSLRAVIDPGSDLPIARPLMQIQSVASNYPVIYHADLDGDGYGQFSFTAGATETVPLKIGIGVDTTEDGFTDILFGWPQLEKSAAATAYQTRVSKYDVTEAGVDDCYGLTFDGVDDYMVTAANLDLSGSRTNHATTGAFKASDDAVRAIFHHGFSEGGSQVAQLAPPGATNGGFSGYASFGTARAISFTADPSVDAPVNSVVSTWFDADTPFYAIRIDGEIKSSSGGSLGAGTGGNGKFYLASRDGAARLFNGTIYGVTLTDYILDAGQLASLEEWTAANTPEVTLI